MGRFADRARSRGLEAALGAVCSSSSAAQRQPMATVFGSPRHGAMHEELRGDFLIDGFVVARECYVPSAKYGKGRRGHRELSGECCHCRPDVREYDWDADLFTNWCTMSGCRDDTGAGRSKRASPSTTKVPYALLFRHGEARRDVDGKPVIVMRVTLFAWTTPNSGCDPEWKPATHTELHCLSWLRLPSGVSGAASSAPSAGQRASVLRSVG